ncbi:MAG: HpcH/HpaI aldolase/citrate lyase family protein [Undibacterium sp.]|nr:HpcH/HpaI aldolase/citrate lyase family protein [Undibacterium sp.]
MAKKIAPTPKARSAMGASLYVPTTHKDLLKIANGELLETSRSLIFCTEDAVSEKDLSYALFNLSVALENMRTVSVCDRFVRVRSPEVLQRVLAMKGSEHLSGFVLPKITYTNFNLYFDLLKQTQHRLMPTLETLEVFDDDEMQQLRKRLQAPQVRGRILALRIGGNDLLSLLGMRRPRNATLYSTPLGIVIARLVTIFKPYGFDLTAPVFEYLDLPELLEQELRQDLHHGLIGKTAIHPSQIAQIERHYRVKQNELATAKAILDESSPAVFKMHEAMCEVATHKAWAERTIAQAEIFGMHALE